MTHALRAGLTFCAVEDRLLFLDVPADRYFCLAPAAEDAVRRLQGGAAPDTADRAALAGLVRAGLLVEAPDAPMLAPCPPAPSARYSLLDGPMPRPRGSDVAAALLQLVAARIELRLTGFAATLGRVARRKQRLRGRAGPHRIAAIAAAFHATGGWVSVHDRCLPRAIAVAHRLMRAGASPDLVLAVKLGPFKAHAWVQCGDALVNERPEVTRAFTPILVL